MKLTPLRSYHGDPELKALHDNWIRNDIRADRLIAGTYGDHDGDGWRGCQWGCYLHAADPHAVVEKRLGLPLQLSLISDALFESLSSYISAEAGRAFAEKFFLEALQVDVDYSRVYPRFAAWLMADMLPQVKDEQVIAVLKSAEALFTRMAETGEVDDSEFLEVRRAALAALDARAALDALDARAARAALAALDARAARAALDALDARAALDALDARAARAALDARAASYQRMADKLIELVKAESTVVAGEAVATLD
jgi:hypothetical protein